MRELRNSGLLDAVVPEPAPVQESEPAPETLPEPTPESEPAQESEPAPESESAAPSEAAPPSARRAERRGVRPLPLRRRGSVPGFAIAVLILLGLGVLGLFTVRPLLANDPNPTAAATDYPGPGTGEVVVTIPEGASSAEMAEVLVEAEVVFSADAFEQAYEANPDATAITAGSYSLLRQMTAKDAVAALLDPRRRADLVVTIPEGYRTDQVYARVADALGVPVADVAAAASDYAGLGLDGPPTTDPNALDPMEGWFYPDTYAITPGASAVEVLRAMVERTISELDALAVAPENRMHVLTVASIAATEIPSADYWPQVTRVIENRLVPGNATGETKLGMDATLTYWWNRQNPTVAIDPALYSSTEGGAYNTRVSSGLPPTPIAAVSSRAIAAAVAPAAGTWAYVLPTDLCPPGVVEFADTSEQFRALQEKFRQWNEAYLAGGSVCPVPQG